MTIPAINEVLAKNRVNLKPNQECFQVAVVSNTFVSPLNEYIDFQLRALDINALSTLIDFYSIEEQKKIIAVAKGIFVDYDPFRELQWEPSDFSSYGDIDNRIIKKTQLDLSRIASLLPRDSIILVKLFSALHLTEKCKQLTILDKSAIWLNKWMTETYPQFHYIEPKRRIAEEVISYFPRTREIKKNYPLYYIFNLSLQIAELFSEVLCPIKKVLILDCDGTLWKGLIGEQDVKELFFYDEIHSIIKMLKENGVIICFVTKNEQSNIDRFFDQKGIIEKHDIYKVYAGWEPKSTSVAKIAIDLNLDFSSMVFVDDSIHEINEVKHYAPSVMTLLVNPTYDIYLKDFVALVPLFYKGKVTNEDRIRTLDYQASSVRKSDERLYSNEIDYLKSLKMQVQIKTNINIDYNRVSQLTLRTNQFNLTQSRLQPDEVRQFLSMNDSFVITFDLIDRYSQLGVVCVCFLKKLNETLRIENINLSCRAFGRKLEFLVMDVIVNLAIQNNIKNIEGVYIPSNKNSYCKNYFIENGFSLQKEDSTSSNFSLRIEDFLVDNLHTNLFEVKL
jgi:FkbH-like protein